MNCKIFVEAAIIKPIITLIFIAWLLYIIKIYKFLFSGTLVSSVMENCCWHEFQGFCANNHLYESIIMLMPIAWWHHQNKEIFVYLNGDSLCLFEKLLLTWISRFLQNQLCHLWAYNHVGAYCILMSSEQEYFSLFECWLPLFHKMLQIWNSKFVEAAIYESAMRLVLTASWCHWNKEVCLCLNIDCFSLKAHCKVWDHFW